MPVLGVTHPCDELKGLPSCFRSVPRHSWNLQHVLACKGLERLPRRNFARGLIWTVPWASKYLTDLFQ